MILIGLGANLPSPVGPPAATILAACQRLGERAVRLLQLSPLYISAPQPASDQPWFVNAVARVDSHYEPNDLLTVLHEVEDVFGRVRAVRWGPRSLDLDLLAYGERVVEAARPDALALPHPRLRFRRFVLRPLMDIAPGWRYPVSGQPVEQLLAALGEADPVERLR